MKQPQNNLGCTYQAELPNWYTREVPCNTNFQIVLNHASPPLKNLLKSHGTPPPQTELSKFFYPKKSRNGKFAIPP